MNVTEILASRCSIGVWQPRGPRVKGELAYHAHSLHRMAPSLRLILSAAMWFSAVGITLAQPVDQGPMQNSQTSEPANVDLEKQAEALRKRAVDLYNEQKYLDSINVSKELMAVEERRFPKDKFPNGHPGLADTLSQIGRCNRMLHNFEELREFSSSALAVRRSSGDSKASIVNNLVDVAIAHVELRDNANAERFVREAAELASVTFSEQLYPESHPYLARVESCFGEICRAQGHLENAVAHFNSCLNMCRKYCAKHEYSRDNELANLAYDTYVHCLMCIGDLRLYRGEFVDAIAAYKERETILRTNSVKQERRDLGEQIAVTIRNLGIVYFRQGRLDEAKDHLERAVEMLEKLEIQGDVDQERVALSLRDLATVNQSAGNVNQAKEYCGRALKVMQNADEAKKRKGNETLASILSRYGSILADLGDLEAARKHLEDALAIRRLLRANVSIPEQRRLVAITLCELATIYLAQGELQRSRDYFQEAVDIFRELFPPESYPNGHSELAMSLQNIGHIQLLIGDIDESFDAYKEAADMWQQLANEDERRVDKRTWAVALDQLGNAYRERGDFENAKECLRKSYEMIQSFYPPDRFPNGHTDLIQSLLRIERLHRYSGKLTDALRCTTEALELSRKLYPKDLYPNGHPDLALVYQDHAIVLHGQGDYMNSSEYALKVVQMRQSLAEKILPGLSETECLNYVQHQLQFPSIFIAAWQDAERSADELYEILWNCYVSL